MKKKTLVYVLICSIVAVIVVNSALPRTTISEASWAHYYKSVDELYTRADLVILCEVSSSISYYEKASIFGEKDISTNYTMKILEVYKGTPENKNIIVHQTGGKLGNKVHYISDDPLIDHEKMILFLRRYHYSQYAILGGPQGRYIIRNDNVYSIGEVNSKASGTTDHLSTQGLTIDLFINNLT